jgi:thiosulfate/3-mercaptopyruvate sulfurtransferase
MAHTSPLVSADWLKENLRSPDLRIIDASWFPTWASASDSGRQSYERGHIPGAVYFDIDEIAASETDLPHMMPDPVKFSSRVRKLGIGDGNRIVVYDANDFLASARVWWMFRVMGHTEIYVLNGGLRAWQASGGVLEDLPPVITGGRHFTPRVRTDLIKTMDQMKTISSSGRSPVVDARPAGRFSGEEKEPREGLQSGHIPGSANVPSGKLVGNDGRLAERAALAERLDPYRKGPVVASCGSGVSAAVVALALAELGNWDVAVYDGSWTEWASNPDNKIAAGSA